MIGGFVIRVLQPGGSNGLVVNAAGVRAIGAALVVCGLGTAVWARVTLGRNWGMPMTEKDQPELVSSGPYRLVRHPIYSGIVLATVGTALAVSLGWLVVAAVMGVYFGYSAAVEERTLDRAAPGGLPALPGADENAHPVRALITQSRTPECLVDTGCAHWTERRLGVARLERVQARAFSL